MDIKLVARYWKNGVPVTLTDSTLSAFAVSIIVKDNSIYVSGFEYTGAFSSSNTNVYLWKDGIKTNLNSGIGNIIPFGLFIKDSDIFVAGTEAASIGNYYPKYWKNNLLIPVTTTETKGEVNGVFVK